jgi:hypothetical protein
VRLAVAGLLFILVATVGASITVLLVYGGSPGDRFAAEGVVLGSGTFLLATWAAVIAAVAYAQSDRRPALEAQVRLLFDAPAVSLAGERTPQVVVHSLWAASGVGNRGDQWPDGSRLPNCVLQTQITNVGEVTARNVMLTVDIWELQFFGMEPAAPGWTVVDRDYALGRSRFQWDGGADQAVHQGQTRPLPDIRLDTCVAIVGTHLRIKATVVADQTGSSDTAYELPVVGPLA